MPPTNVIINGTFDAGNTGWGGNDLETNYSENAYLGNGSGNRVAEIDGRSGQTTVMEQTFTVNDAQTTELTLDVALRNASLGNAGSEGFTLQILDDVGAVIATTTVLPTTNTWEEVTLPVDFPDAGDYTLRITELGPDDSLGAIIDNVELLVCFAGDTQIEMAEGFKAAGEIEIGDLVMTAQGAQAVRWVGRRAVSADDLAAEEMFRPVLISEGALGNGLPKRALRVSRQHRMQVSSPIAERMFETKDVLIPAAKLTGLPGIYVDEKVQDIEYVHFLFDDHEIVYAEGCPSESLLVGPEAWESLTDAARAEIRLMFPELGEMQDQAETALPVPRNAAQFRFVARLMKNKRPPLEFYDRAG